ncbi:MAG: hypothetical protein L0Y58_21595 [Verrucomicrobia subdivision 3 bacterium]|nr:hypothetical protein [Limisphaerales bacterium]
MPRLWTLLFFSLVVPPPDARTQFPSPPALTGSTLGTNLRNAAAATHTQATVLRTALDNWSRRANSGTYTGDDFQRDFVNVQSQFQALRNQFDWLGQLALQLGRPRADNAVAELDAGLNIIAELFIFLDQQFAAGTLDRATILRTARVFQKAVQEWERELRKNTSRLGLAG